MAYKKSVKLVATLLNSEHECIRQPDMVIVYLRYTCIMGKQIKGVLTNIEKELTSLHTIFPECLIVWSDILPDYFHKQGMTYRAPGNVDPVNQGGHALVTKLGGRVLIHDNIGAELYQAKGNAKVISDEAIERSNLNIQEFVLKWEMEVNALSEHIKPIPESPKPTMCSLKPTPSFPEPKSSMPSKLSPNPTSEAPEP